MKILSVLEHANLIVEISREAQLDATRMSKADFGKARMFIKRLLDAAKSYQIPSLGRNEVLSAMTRFKHRGDVKGYYLGHDVQLDRGRGEYTGREEDRLKGFTTPDEDRIKTDEETNKYVLIVGDALLSAPPKTRYVKKTDDGRLQVTNPEAISRMADFIYRSGKSTINDIAANFNQAIKNYTHSAKARMHTPSDDMGEVQKNIREMDFNTLLFLLAMQPKKDKLKRSWDELLNVNRYKQAAKRFENLNLNPEEAVNNLISLGLIQERDGMLQPNRQAVEEMLFTFTEGLESALEVDGKTSTSIGVSNKGAQPGKMRDTVIRYKQLENFISQQINPSVFEKMFRVVKSHAENMSGKTKAVMDFYNRKSEERESGEYGISDRRQLQFPERAKSLSQIEQDPFMLIHFTLRAAALKYFTEVLLFAANRKHKIAPIGQTLAASMNAAYYIIKGHYD
jgi:hypothetical protein